MWGRGWGSFIFAHRCLTIPMSTLNICNDYYFSLFFLSFFLFFFFNGCTACGILVPWPRIEPVPTAVETQSPNPWTARKSSAMIINTLRIPVLGVAGYQRGISASHTSLKPNSWGLWLFFANRVIGFRSLYLLFLPEIFCIKQTMKGQGWPSGLATSLWK